MRKCSKNRPKIRRGTLNHYRKHGNGVVVACILAASAAATAAAFARGAVAPGHEEREVLPFLALVGLPEQDVRPLHLLVPQLPLEEHSQGHTGPIDVGVHLHRSSGLQIPPPPIRRQFPPKESSGETDLGRGKKRVEKGYYHIQWGSFVTDQRGTWANPTIEFFFSTAATEFPAQENGESLGQGRRISMRLLLLLA